MNSKINQKTLDILERLSAFCKKIDNNVFFVVFGGWAVDGHAGRITWDHKDIDCLCWRQDIKIIKKVLNEFGYSYEEVSLPREPDFIYKIVTKDKIFTFHLIDKKPGEQFEISFYNSPHLIFPLKYLEPILITLNGVGYPVIDKEFLTKLK